MTTQHVESAATYTARECIRAGVRPGLQNRCHPDEWSIEQIGERDVFLVRRVICGPCWEREILERGTAGWGPDVAKNVAKPQADAALVMWLMGAISGACVALLAVWAMA